MANLDFHCFTFHDNFVRDDDDDEREVICFMCAQAAAVVVAHKSLIDVFITDCWLTTDCLCVLAQLLSLFYKLHFTFFLSASLFWKRFFHIIKVQFSENYCHIIKVLFA